MRRVARPHEPGPPYADATGFGVRGQGVEVAAHEVRRHFGVGSENEDDLGTAA